MLISWPWDGESILEYPMRPTAGWEAISQGAQAASRSWEGQANGLSPRASCDSADSLLSVWWDPVQTLDLQDCKVRNSCCFNPLSLWSFVTAATGNWYTLFLDILLTSVRAILPFSVRSPPPSLPLQRDFRLHVVSTLHFSFKDFYFLRNLYTQLKLTTPRGRVTCSTDRASQAPWLFNRNIYWKKISDPQSCPFCPTDSCLLRRKFKCTQLDMSLSFSH